MAVIFEKDENILHEVRKHWFIIASEAFSIFALMVAPIILKGIFNSILVGNINIIFWFFYLIWLFLLWNAFMFMWTDYYLDVWIITDKRLIDVEQKGLFRREIASVELSKIQDVTSDVHGIIPTLLSFGELHIQTAGTEKEFVIKGVNNPNQMRQNIYESVKRYGHMSSQT